MNKEQKIILSLYYANPNAEPSQISEAAYSIGMDMLQMLLLMEGVFDKVEYNYYLECGKVQCKPAGDKNEEYEGLIEQSDPELKKAQILAVMYGGIWRFEKQGYMDVNFYCHDIPDVKKHLYFFNILINNVNGRSLLQERETLVVYRLFSIRGGKEFVRCLYFMMEKLVSAFLDRNKKEANGVIETLNKDYELIKASYENRQNFLKNMWKRKQRMHYLKQSNFFVNQSEIFETWIEEHLNAIEEDMLEFIFYKNKVFKNYALHFMLHIVKISRVLMKNSAVILWEQEFKRDSFPELKPFCHLDHLVQRLEGAGKSESFDIPGWAGEYRDKLFSIAKELRL